MFCSCPVFLGKITKEEVFDLLIEQFQYYILHCPKCVFFFIITICTGKKKFEAE